MSMALTLFDCNAMIGGRMARSAGEVQTVEDLLRELDHLGVAEALTYHALAKEYSPEIGNALLLQEIRGTGRLHPCWVLLPAHTEEMEPARVLIPRMLSRGVAAVRLFPSPPVPLPEFSDQLHHYALVRTVVGDLLEALEAHRVPLFLEIMNLSSQMLVGWEQLEWLLSTFPKLPVVIVGTRHRDNRTLYAFLERFPQLAFDISLYAIHRGIEDVARRFGADRMLFGTGLPVYAGGGAVVQLASAEIPEEQKQMIAADNLRRLLARIIHEEHVNDPGLSEQ